MHFQQRHFKLSLFVPYHSFPQLLLFPACDKETESRVTEFVCSGGDGNKDQGPQYMSWPLPQLVVNISPLEIVFLFFRFVFSAEEGVKVRAGSD